MSTPNSEKHQTPVSARRRLLQVMAVGGTAAVVLPEKWVKPVVDAVIVPAHAAGSVVPVSGIFGNHGTIVSADSGQGNFLERVAGMVVGSAHASNLSLCGLEINGSVVDICFDIPPYSVNNVNSTATVYVDCSSYSTPYAPVISPVNTIGNVICNNLTFTNVTWTTNSLSGHCASSRNDCASGSFTLYKRSARQTCSA